MNDSLFSTKDMVKYLIVGGLVYAILKMIPSVQLADKDLMLLLAIITVGFVCLDCLFLKKNSTEGFANDDPFTLDLETDINHLIKQRQDKKKTSRKEAIGKHATPEEAERHEILSKLNDKRRKTSNPIEVTKNAIKKLDDQIANAFSGADVEKAKKAKSELEAKLKSLKAQHTAQQESKIADKRAIMEEKNTADEEYIQALKSSKSVEEKLAKLKERKAKATSAKEAKDIQIEINIATKAKEVSDQRVNIIEKRKEQLKKKLANIPVSESEEHKLAIEEHKIADERVAIADEIKSIVQEHGSTDELKQIAQEHKDAVMSKVEAEDRLVRVIMEEKPSKRVIIDPEIKLPEDQEDTVSETSLPKTSCGIEVEKIKRKMEEEMAELKEQLIAKSTIPPSSAKIANRYFEFLINDLADKGILDATEIDNIQAKLRSKLLSMDEVIASLETLKKEGKSKIRVQDGKVKNDREYNELPSDFYTPIGNQVPTDWSSEYTILNTNKWQVPMPRPPVCINTTPCKVCPSDTSSTTVNLKEWDDSRYVTGGKINKKWAEDQNSA